MSGCGVISEVPIVRISRMKAVATSLFRRRSDERENEKIQTCFFTIFVSTRQQIIVIVAAMKTLARYRLTLCAM